MTAHIQGSQAGTADRRWDDIQFRVIFAVSFLVFLVGAVAMRLTPKYWRDLPHRSIFAQAWEASGTTAQIAFFRLIAPAPKFARTSSGRMNRRGDFAVATPPHGPSR